MSDQTLTAAEILKTLPHRYPILLVDRIIECDLEAQNIVGLKNVSMNEPYFQGHFPGMPVMPGVLQLEALAQTGGVLLNAIAGTASNIPYFMAIDKARFRKVVIPGDQLRLEVQILKLRTRSVKLAARALVDGAVASEAQLMCMITDQKAEA